MEAMFEQYSSLEPKCSTERYDDNDDDDDATDDDGDDDDSVELMMMTMIVILILISSAALRGAGGTACNRLCELVLTFLQKPMKANHWISPMVSFHNGLQTC